jgi:hypothetical protein
MATITSTISARAARHRDPLRLTTPDDFARGSAQATRKTEQNPDMDSGPSAQPVGSNSTLDEIIAFGRAANDDVRRGKQLEAEGLCLQFHGIIRVILSLYWAKLRIEDDDKVPRKAKNAAFLSAAKQMGVARTYAYALLKLHNRVTELRTWGEVYKREDGKYPSAHAMIEHCGVGSGGRKSQIELLRAALADSQAREDELRRKLAESEAEMAALRKQRTFPVDEKQTDGHPTTNPLGGKGN